VVRPVLFPTSKGATRHKSAQILSAIHPLALPEFEPAGRGHPAAIEAGCTEMSQSGELGKPTIKHLQSL
jgi:hypothetical protein